jgi:cell division protein FtsZ
MKEDGLYSGGEFSPQGEISPGALYGARQSGQAMAALGLGGWGAMAINRLSARAIPGLRLISASSSPDQLENSLAECQIALPSLKGSSPVAWAAKESRLDTEAAAKLLPSLAEMLSGSSLVFILAGLGGSSGSALAPMLATALSEAKEPPVISAVMVSPFDYERKSQAISQAAIEELRKACFSLLVIPNSDVLANFPDEKLESLMNVSFEVASEAILAISGTARQILSGPMPDPMAIREFLRWTGQSVIGYAQASGPHRLERAMQGALSFPLMDRRGIWPYRHILVWLSAGNSLDSLGQEEFNLLNEMLTQKSHESSEIVLGIGHDPSQTGDLLSLTVLATGLRGLNELEGPEGAGQEPREGDGSGYRPGSGTGLGDAPNHCPPPGTEGPLGREAMEPMEPMETMESLVGPEATVAIED